jgi:phosphoglucosamine mutase
VIDYFEGGQKYIQYLKQTVDDDFSGLHIALDCANGATYSLANYLFADLDADLSTMAASPDGLNINDGVGSTHPEALAEFVLEKGADCGLAFDGDGDRVIAVDENGEIVDGDQIMYICGKYLKQQGRLKNHTIVSTVMSNLGFYKALEREGIVSVRTPVGDRYVAEEMRKNGYNLGGEQSGHIIFFDYNTTGDGMLTALQLVDTVVQSGKRLSELTSLMRKYPQVLVNVRVADKSGLKDNEEIARAIREAEHKLGENGRVLVRPSGTEPLIRVMAEGPDQKQIESCVREISRVIERELS